MRLGALGREGQERARPVEGAVECGVRRVVRLLVTSGTIAHQTLKSIGFSKQECWSELPCPPPGDLPESGIELVSLMSPALVGGFLKVQLVKNPPAMEETWVQSLGWEDLLEKGKAIHSTILAQRIPWTV